VRYACDVPLYWDESKRIGDTRKVPRWGCGPASWLPGKRSCTPRTRYGVPNRSITLRAHRVIRCDTSPES